MAMFGTKVTAVVCCAETMTRLYFVMINLQKLKLLNHDSVQPCQGIGACSTFQDRIKSLTISLGIERNQEVSNGPL